MYFPFLDYLFMFLKNDGRCCSFFLKILDRQIGNLDLHFVKCGSLGAGRKSPSVNWMRFIIRPSFSRFVAKCEVIKGKPGWRGRKDLWNFSSLGFGNICTGNNFYCGVIFNLTETRKRKVTHIYEGCMCQKQYILAPNKSSYVKTI